MVVRLVQLPQVVIVWLQRYGFGVGAFAVDAAQQDVGRRLQVDDEIRRRDVVREQLVQALVDEQLVVVEIQIREDLVLIEEVVADSHLAEEIGLAERDLLAMAVEQVEELCLQGRAGAIGVEVGEEGVLGFLEDDRGIEPRAEPFGQRGLARADGTFDREVAELQDGADDIIALVSFAPAWRRRVAAQLVTLAVLGAAVSARAQPAPTLASASAQANAIFEKKMSSILKLEDMRVLRDPAPVVAPVMPPAKNGKPAVVVPPPPPPDLLRMLSDGEGRIRRRAALAIGRVGLPAGVPPLVDLMKDADPEVRQMAAFALGLIGDKSARDPLIAALTDASPLMKGSAAEALGLIGDAAAAEPIGRMVAGIAQSGALTPVPSDADEFRRDTPAAAFKLGVAALTRLKAYDQLAAAVIDPAGKLRTTWWPVAFALQRLEDKRALPFLLALANDPDPYARAFAVKGLGALKDRSAVAVLLPLVASRDAAVQVEAIRALGKIGDAAAAQPLVAVAQGRNIPAPLRLEAVTALGGLRAAGVGDVLVDLLGDRDPLIRAAALTSASTAASDEFVTILSGLDPDADWHVRASLAVLLGTLPRQSALPRLTALLKDSDQRVIVAVLTSLVKLAAPGIGEILLDHLKSDDPVVRAAAASGIGEIRLPAGAQALPAAYQFALKDTTYVARAAAIEAFAKYGITVSRSLLDAALADKDWAVRARAASLLRQGDPASDADAKSRPAPTRLAPEAYNVPALVNPAVSTQAFIDTARGTIQIELAVLDAPLTVDNFVALVRRGFFTNLTFHRVVPDFVIQGGDPRGDGEGGPGYNVRDELSERSYLRGTVGIALDWADTGGSQFFITHSPQPHLDAKYTVIGRVISGMDVVDQIQQNDVIRRIRVWDGQQMIGGTE